MAEWNKNSEQESVVCVYCADKKNQYVRHLHFLRDFCDIEGLRSHLRTVGYTDIIVSQIIGWYMTIHANFSDVKLDGGGGEIWERWDRMNKERATQRKQKDQQKTLSEKGLQEFFRRGGKLSELFGQKLIK